MNITEVAGLNETERFEHEWKGVKFWFEAKKCTLTPEFLQRCYDADRQPSVLAAVLADTISDWDVASDSEGTKWPLKAENIAKLPTPFLNSIVGKISDSWSGNDEPQTESQSTSAAAAK